MTEAHNAFSDLMPRYGVPHLTYPLQRSVHPPVLAFVSLRLCRGCRVLRDLMQLDEATETHERQLVLSFGELLKEAQDHTTKVHTHMHRCRPETQNVGFQ